MSQVPGCDAQKKPPGSKHVAVKAGQPRAGGEQEARQGQRLLEETHFLSNLFHKPEWRRRSGKPGPALSSGITDQRAAGTPLSPQLPKEAIYDFRLIPGWKLFPAVLKRSASPANGLFEPEG